MKTKLEKREIKEIIEDEESITIILNKDGYEEIGTEELAIAVDETIVQLLTEKTDEAIEEEIDEDAEEIEDEDALIEEDEEIEEDAEVEEEEEDEEIDENEEEIDEDEDELEDEKEIEEDEIEEGYHVMPDGTIMPDSEHDDDEEEIEEESKLRTIWGKKDKTEKRFFKVESRVSKKGKKNIIEGHAAVFNELSEDLGGFREKINPGAFDEVLDNDVRAFFNHDPNFLLARTSSGTLKLSTDKRGLKYSFDVPDTTAGRDLLVSMKRGDITQSSFAFQVESDSWNTTSKGEIRTIEKVSRLYDVSPVSIPAYPTANDLAIAQRSRMINNDKTKMKHELDYEMRTSLLKLKINILKRK
tara:strand:+ start:1193 stop:2263 length:1071 start_codon:yes stop_codon:yes gene_type:complete